MRVNERLVIIGSLLLAAAWAVWCVFSLPTGLDFTHEGLYCAGAWRFAHGDVRLQGISFTFYLRAVIPVVIPGSPYLPSIWYSIVIPVF